MRGKRAGGRGKSRGGRGGSRVRRSRGTGTTEPREATLRLALSLGREAAELAAESPPVPADPPRPAVCRKQPVLALGVITAPGNTLRRTFIRRIEPALMRERPCEVRVTFLLGLRRFFTAEQNSALDREQAAHRDLLYLPAHDGLATAVSHGGRAVAEKALAWWIYAANHTVAPFIAKVDDDSMPHLPRLVDDLRVLQATPRADASMAYYGVLVYRMWDWKSREPNAACGGHADDGPPSQGPHAMLAKLLAARQRGGECAGAMGPYPFPDGSFEIVGLRLARAVFGAPRVRALAARRFSREGRRVCTRNVEHAGPAVAGGAAAAAREGTPAGWTHEDAGVGAIVQREAEERALALTYVALRRWAHNRFWINWADRSTLVDGRTLWAHYTRSAERGGASRPAAVAAAHGSRPSWRPALWPARAAHPPRLASLQCTPPRPRRADYVLDAYRATAAMPADGLACGGCVEQWRWTPPTPRAVCCTKPDTKLRPPPSRRAAWPAERREPALGPPCGLGEGGAAVQLGLLSVAGDTDERSRLRDALRARRAPGGALELCFVLTAHALRSQAHRTGNFNVRAWLHYEAGRHADLDLSALGPMGIWPATAHMGGAWWARAAAHAARRGAAKFYALGSVASVEALPPPWLAALLAAAPTPDMLLPPGGAARGAPELTVVTAAALNATDGAQRATAPSLRWASLLRK